MPIDTTISRNGSRDVFFARAWGIATLRDLELASRHIITSPVSSGAGLLIQDLSHLVRYDFDNDDIASLLARYWAGWCPNSGVLRHVTVGATPAHRQRVDWMLAEIERYSYVGLRVESRHARSFDHGMCLLQLAPRPNLANRHDRAVAGRRSSLPPYPSGY